MNVIWLHQRVAARRSAETGSQKATVQAISHALRYLKEEADDLGEGYLSHLMNLAALDSRPFVAEGQFASADDESESVRLIGIANCLGSLEGEAGETGDGLLSKMIRCARETAEKRVRTI